MLKIHKLNHSKFDQIHYISHDINLIIVRYYIGGQLMFQTSIPDHDSEIWYRLRDIQ